jgi:hypothetical protein
MLWIEETSTRIEYRTGGITDIDDTVFILYNRPVLVTATLCVWREDLQQWSARSLILLRCRGCGETERHCNSKSQRSTDNKASKTSMVVTVAADIGNALGMTMEPDIFFQSKVTMHER